MEKRRMGKVVPKLNKSFLEWGGLCGHCVCVCVEKWGVVCVCVCVWVGGWGDGANEEGGEKDGQKKENG